jgi:ferric-chelate reductase [NAD(P)H]
MYIITTKCDDKINGQIATVVFQVTNKPAQLAVCLSKNTYTHELALQSKVLGISILSEETSIKAIGPFGYRCGRECFKFSNVNYETGVTGVPLVTDNALVIMEIVVTQVVDVGTHSLFIGELKSSKKIRDGVALTYENYHTIKKGKSPENAPTFQNN